MYAGLAILAGIIFLFFGFRLFKPVLALGGFMSLSILTFVVMLNLESNSVDFGGTRDIIFIVSCTIAGLVGAVMMVFFWKLGLFFVGALGGLCFAIFFLSWKENGIIDEGLVRLVFIIASAISCGLLVVYFEKKMIIILTSISGSVLITAGVDNFIQVGFLAAIHTFITNHGTFTVSSSMYGLLGSMVFLALVGVLVQSNLTGRSKIFFNPQK